MSRIIAGRLGGRRLAAPPGRGTRPTSDRVREAVFARLEHLGALDGAAVLDLFAGSGALGFEAVSRGALRATLVEHDRRAVAVCRRNAEDLGISVDVSVRPIRVRQYLAGDPEPADLVFLDPPYDLPEEELSAVLDALTGWAAPAAVIVVERSARSPEPCWPAALSRFDSRDYGETAVWFAEA